MTTPAYENLLVARDAGEPSQSTLPERAELEAVLYTTSDDMAARDAFSRKATPTFLGR